MPRVCGTFISLLAFLSRLGCDHLSLYSPTPCTDPRAFQFSCRGCSSHGGHGREPLGSAGCQPASHRLGDQMGTESLQSGPVWPWGWGWGRGPVGKGQELWWEAACLVSGGLAGARGASTEHSQAAEVWCGRLMAAIINHRMSSVLPFLHCSLLFPSCFQTDSPSEPQNARTREPPSFLFPNPLAL